ncbi:hypothetical protein Efla_003561 [Eimeria flavescens]
MSGPSAFEKHDFQASNLVRKEERGAGKHSATQLLKKSLGSSDPPSAASLVFFKPRLRGPPHEQGLEGEAKSVDDCLVSGGLNGSPEERLHKAKQYQQIHAFIAASQDLQKMSQGKQPLRELLAKRRNDSQKGATAVLAADSGALGVEAEGSLPHLCSSEKRGGKESADYDTMETADSARGDSQKQTGSQQEQQLAALQGASHLQHFPFTRDNSEASGFDGKDIWQSNARRAILELEEDELDA